MTPPYRGPDVFYNWGRWKVQCPSNDCMGVVEVRPGDELAVCDCQDPRFGGGICTHAPLCGTPISLVWPDDPAAVETLCAARPVANRNWHPGESLTQLRYENDLHEVA